MQNAISSPGKRFVLPIIIFLLVIANSCQKWTPALDAGKINLSATQKVQPEDVASWITNNLSPYDILSHLLS